MLRDLGQEGFRQAHSPYYESLDTNSTTPLYIRCTKYTRLSGVLALASVYDYGWVSCSRDLFILLMSVVFNSRAFSASSLE